MITGATGSLGARVHERLLDGGHEVFGLGRNPERLAALQEVGRTMVESDLLTDDLHARFADADAIVHCAAFAAPVGSRRRFFQTNVEGTRRVLEAVGSTRCILISSASVFDADDDSRPHGERPLQRPGHPYAASKFDAERLAEGSDAAWIGLRPRAVIGPGNRTVLPRLGRLVRRGRILIPGTGEARLDFTSMSNSRDAVEAALEAPETAWGRFHNISNGDPRPLKELLTAYAASLPGVHRPRHLPLLPLRIAAQLSRLLPGEPRLNPYALRQLTRSMVLDIEGSREALGWTPQETLEQTLEAL